MRSPWPLLLLAACAKEAPAPPAEESSAPVPYRCAGGVELRALYREDTVAVTLPDGHLVTLPHVVSGSGARYSNDTLTWWTKGDSGFVMAGDSVTIRDCGLTR